MVSVIPKRVYTMNGKMSIIAQNAYYYCHDEPYKESLRVMEDIWICLT